ncbi:(2Fe-2S) ferredoxin domain-containing protein [Actinokineospora sp. 24-640]
MRLTVCAECFSGSVPDDATVDRAGRLARLRALAAETGASVRTADCLDTCDIAGVVVVQAKGSAPVWLGWVLSDAVFDDIESWLTSGGPGVAPLRDTLDLHRITAPGLRRAQ